MFGQQVINQLQTNLKESLTAFVPELLLCLGIVVMLLLRLLPRLRLHMGTVALFFCGFALLLTVGQWLDSESINLLGKIDAKGKYFAGLVVLDHFTSFLRLLLLGFAMLLTWLSMVTGIPDEEDSADFFTLLLGATLGMMLMASANHLLMVFIAVEMASLPCYALAGFLKGRRAGSEASLKYVVYGGGASGVMLYGISLLSGRFGTGYLPDLALAVPDQMRVPPGPAEGPRPFLPPTACQASRSFQKGCSATARRTALMPFGCQGWPWAIGSPSSCRWRIRNSTGSRPSWRASWAIWESRANMVWGEVGAR
jgi:hypothetical protein